MLQVLIVDDHAAVRQSYELLISRMPGIQVSDAVATPQEALRLVGEKEPGVVVVDVSLQGEMDGIELLKRLHADRPHLPVIVVSGHDSAAFGGMMVEMGAHSYVEKGDALAFVAALRSLIPADAAQPEPSKRKPE